MKMPILGHFRDAKTVNMGTGKSQFIQWDLDGMINHLLMLKIYSHTIFTAFVASLCINYRKYPFWVNSGPQKRLIRYWVPPIYSQWHLVGASNPLLILKIYYRMIFPAFVAFMCIIYGKYPFWVISGGHKQGL